VKICDFALPFGDWESPGMIEGDLFSESHCDRVVWMDNLHFFVVPSSAPSATENPSWQLSGNHGEDFCLCIQVVVVI